MWKYKVTGHVGDSRSVKQVAHVKGLNLLLCVSFWGSTLLIFAFKKLFGIVSSCILHMSRYIES